MPVLRRQRQAPQRFDPGDNRRFHQNDIDRLRRQRRKKKEEIVREEVKKITKSRQVELLSQLKKILPPVLTGVMLGSKSVISQTLRLLHPDIAEFFRQIRRLIDPRLNYNDRFVEHYVRVDDFRYKPLARNILWQKQQNDENLNLAFVLRHFSLSILSQNDSEIPLMIARAMKSDIDLEVLPTTIIYEFERCLPEALAQIVLSEYYCSCCQVIIENKTKLHEHVSDMHKTLLKDPEVRGEDVLKQAEAEMVVGVRGAELSCFFLGLFQDPDRARIFRESVHTQMILTDRHMNRAEIIVNECEPVDPGHEMNDPIDHYNLREDFDE